MSKHKAEGLGVVEFLWSLLDDIDTCSDIAKSNDRLYRTMVERIQAKRWKTGVTTDGYNLDFSNMTIPEKIVDESVMKRNKR